MTAATGGDLLLLFVVRRDFFVTIWSLGRETVGANSKTGVGTDERPDDDHVPGRGLDQRRARANTAEDRALAPGLGEVFQDPVPGC